MFQHHGSCVVQCAGRFYVSYKFSKLFQLRLKTVKITDKCRKQRLFNKKIVNFISHTVQLFIDFFSLVLHSFF